jgi:uncharacterized protein YabE (DUF348 family)
VRLRPAALLLQGAVLTTLVGGTTAFVTLDKTVTVAVDGKTREVRSFSRTVADVLAHEDLDVGEHDVVAPALDSPVDDGQRLSVRFGRQLTLAVDGKQRTVWVTARTVDEALDQLGVRADGAFLSASRSRAIGREGLDLRVSTRKKLSLVVGGKRKSVVTTAPDVLHLLREAKVKLTRGDRVTPGLRTPLKPGQTVRVDRVRSVRKVESVSLSYDTVSHGTDDLYEGESRESRAGRTGERRDTYRVTLVNGRQTARKLLDRDYRAPVNRVVLVGTADRPEPVARETERASRSSSRSSDSETSFSSGSSGLNWAALADCESGGDPSAVNAAGYYGLYQFSVSTWESVGGSGLPSEASSSEQTMRAQILYDRTGASSWPVCGAYL